jgi:hypothetical protein
VVTKTLAPTLAVLALGAAAVPAASAADNSDLVLNVGVYIQARAEVDRAKDGAGNDYSPESGTDFDKSDPAEFYLRRARVSFKGMYKEVWGFNITLRGDGAGRNGTNATSTTELLQQAFIYRTWKGDGWSVAPQIGMDYAFHNRAQNVVSSAELLLPNLEGTAHLLNSRAPGVGVRFNSDMVTFGADVQNNTAHTGGTTGAAPPAAENKAEGLFYSARVEITGPDSWRIAKDTESFVGKPGLGARLGLDVAENQNARTGGPPATNSQSTTDVGVDLLVHWDGLTALAESRGDTVKNKADAGASAPDSKRSAWFVQAGYAIPFDGWVLEPAARYERYDFKDTAAGSDTYSGAASANDQLDEGHSGKEIDVGVNLYWDGHKSKTQIEFAHWTGIYGGTAAGAAATSSDKAKANIFRLQQQLVF